MWWLIAAWIAWVAVLVLTVVGYTLSIGNYRYVINALSRGDWGTARRVPKLSNYIEPLNITVSVLAVCGFVFFGYFAIGTLERISNAESQITASPGDGPKTKVGDIREAPAGKLGATLTAGVPAP